METSHQSLLGRYRLLAELGHGGMADVYLACMNGPGGFQKLLVIKIARLTDDPAFVQMFLDEARLAARLSHPNVVHTYEVGDEGGRQFIVMEYLDGCSLQRLNRKAIEAGGMPLAVTVQIISHVLEGLEYAHTLTGFSGEPLKVVHRDLTPHNLMVTVQGVAKILDFGIAKAADSRTVTQTGFYRGKLNYMAPEQARGDTVDKRADLFSLGVVLAEAITKKPFWGEMTGPVLSSRLLSGDIPDITANKIDPELEEICSQVLSADPSKRLGSAAELKEMLDWYLGVTGAALNPHQLAAFVTPLVAEDRARIKIVIEQALKTEPTPVKVLELPKLERLVATPHMQSHAIVTPPGASPSRIPAATVTIPAGKAGPVNDSSDEAPTVARQISDELMRDSGRHQHAKRGPAWLVLSGVAAIVLVVGVALLVLSDRKPSEPPATVPLTKTVVDAPVVPAKPPPTQVAVVVPARPPEASSRSEVRLTIRVNPARARLRLDGRTLPNPYEGMVPQDNGEHVLQADAPGHEPLTTSLTFEKDLLLQLSLQRAAAAGSGPRKVSARPAAARPAEEPAKERPPPATTPAAVAAQPHKGNNIEEVKPVSPARGDKKALDTDVFDEKKRDIERDPWTQ